ncbi:hypothetical protein J4573_29465 [Actinomadura barringtoniae]|uniref:LuxR family transcriptional regulator n=1 Tax=Actinomadura barringtoniae TaxID=1427535 RepID=A0A939T6U1_9ACTN|nr:hypothetical protein [Actinomadura barringtoniae]MBO2451254.1 hypothetical protein [Actinomadura barringtoniae]
MTVTGVGGVGKSRVALRAAETAARDFPDGVWLVELSELQDPAMLTHVVAHTIGLQDQTVRPQIDVLSDFLAERNVLLLLDTCEHLLDACAMLAEVLLAASPGSCVLATSRRPLGVAVERVFAVPPMAVPEPDSTDTDSLAGALDTGFLDAGPSGLGLPGAIDPDPGSMDSRRAWCDSMMLFAERARAADPGFLLTPRNHAEVSRLCRRLDGIPLAIELAAVWVQTLTIEQMLEQLDHRFKLLSGGYGAVARHETLRAAVGWSHQLCEPVERLMWARLAVFAGPFDAAAVTAVCADAQIPVGMVPRLLNRLTEKSVLLEEPPHGGQGTRYRLLDTLREYGWEWLTALGEHIGLQRRHRDQYLALARRCVAEWCGPDQVEWCERMGRERSDLRAALEFSLTDPAEHEAGLELAGSLYFFWGTSGLIREGRYYLDRYLALDLPPSPALTRALGEGARIATLQGDPATARELIERCRPFAEEQHLTATSAQLSYLEGATATLRGDHEYGGARLDEAIALYRQGGSSGTGLLFTIAVRGMAHTLEGDVDLAIVRLEECRTLCDEHGERWVRSFADSMRGLAELRRGDVESATWYARESLRFKEQLPDRTSTALALDLLATIAASGGEAERAARLLGFADRLWASFGMPQGGYSELRTMREPSERKARQALGADAYDKAFWQGHDLSFSTGVGYALDAAPPRANGAGESEPE